MQTALHSPFLQALGYAIANSLWQMALVWILFSLLNIIFKPGSAHKFRLAFSAQLTGFIWFIITLQFYLIKCTDALQTNTTWQQASSVSFIFPKTDTNFSSVFLNILIKGEQLLPFLSFAYLLLLVILLAKWIGQYYRTQYIRSNGLLEIDEQWKQFIANISEKLNIRNTIDIYVSELINSPLTIGFVKPVILVPIASINHLSVSQLEAVLLHELAHIKRYDYILNIFISVIETSLFFNPFTQLISKNIKAERENSCDDWVLQFQYNPAMYAEALLQLAYLSGNPPLSATSLSMNAAKQNGDLLSRVKRMIGSNDNRFKYRHQLLSLLLITCILSSVAWLHPAAYSKKQVAVVTQRKEAVVVEPLTAKIDNPLFNPVFFLKKPLQEEVERSMKLAVKSLDISEKALKQSDEMLATVAPAAIHAVENLNIEETEKDIANSLNTLDEVKEFHLPKIKIDTIAIKKSLETVFNKGLSFSFGNANSEIRHAKREYEKMMIQNRMNAEEDKKQQEEWNKAFAELQHLKIPFIAKSFEPRFKKELSQLMQKADSLKSSRIKFHAPQARFPDDDMIESEATPSFFQNSDDAKQSVTLNTATAKNISVIKHSAHSTNKSIEIIFSPDQNKEPIKIIIEVNKD